MKDQNKIHETEADRTREREIIERLISGTRLNYVMNSPLSPFDATINDHRTPIAIVEVKTRTCKFRAYPDYTVDKLKVDKLIRLAKFMRVKAVMVVDFNGDTRFVCPNEFVADLHVTTQTRKDRNEVPDEVYHFPWCCFRSLSEKWGESDTATQP